MTESVDLRRLSEQLLALPAEVVVAWDRDVAPLLTNVPEDVWLRVHTHNDGAEHNVVFRNWERGPYLWIAVSWHGRHYEESAWWPSLMLPIDRYPRETQLRMLFSGGFRAHDEHNERLFATYRTEQGSRP